MAITSIDIDQDELKQAKQLAGTKSNRETVDLALRTPIAVRRQHLAEGRQQPRRCAAAPGDISPAPHHHLPAPPSETAALDIQQALWDAGLMRAAAAFDWLIAAFAIVNNAVILNSGQDFGYIEIATHGAIRQEYIE